MRRTITDEQIIAALLANDTKQAACKSLKIGRDTLSKRMKSPEFRTKYRQAKDDLITGIINKMVMSMTSAVQTITDIMNNAENPPQIRLNASDSIMRYGIKLIEQRDILERLEALEAIINEDNTI